jgi:hypothetical protein
MEKHRPVLFCSHRWGAEEATFHDIVAGYGKSKAGYQKILFLLATGRCPWSAIFLD